MRELSNESARFQAEQYIAWSSKAENDHVGAFARWAASKDFAPADARYIADLVRHWRVAPKPGEGETA